MITAMKIKKHIKSAIEARKRRFQRLLDRIAATNDTGLSDDSVLAILNARRGPWTECESVEELLESLGIEM